MMRTIKILGKTLLALIVISGIYMAFNWPFWSNVLTLSMNFSTSVTDESLYEPKEVVKGNFQEPLLTIPKSLLSNDTQKTLRSFMAQNKSAALVIYQGNAIHFEEYGDGFDANLRTESASMAKSVLGMMIGAAIDDGYIKSADDPIGNYYKPWAGTPKGKATIKEYLQMTAGLRIHPLFGPPSSVMFQAYMGDNIPKQMQKIDLEFQAGTEFQYNSLNSQALMMALEAASGKRYSDYLSDTIWKNIGAKDAAVWLDRKGGVPRAFCCLYATARDWVRVAKLHLNNGGVNGKPVISAPWMKAIITPSEKNPNYGYQTWLGTKYQAERMYNNKVSVTAKHAAPFKSADIIYFDGAGGQRVYISPSFNLIIVHTGPLNFEWEESYLPNLIIGDLTELLPKFDITDLNKEK